MNLSRQYSFWGSLSPLGGLTGAGLLIMASARLSWAISIAGCLFWVYGLTSLVFTLLFTTLGNKYFPIKYRTTLLTCIAFFFGSLYLFLFWFLSPFAAMEVLLILLLVPVFCAGSGIGLSLTESTHCDVFDNVSEAVSQAATLAGLIIAFSVVREPFSYCSLSFPGSMGGMITIMYFNSGSFVPVGIFAPSAGALLILGYVICMYQYSKNKKGVN